MTKQHLELIAAVLKAQAPHMRDDVTAEQITLWNGIVSAMADACQSANARFDRDRFFKACSHLS